ncbi:MAG: RHS repeat-associated core domain-containing protein [Candidatus Algichlamydia australiensis]|nr:RHS repeat-associated core domain-containing protein [Chlamydiales bacterium]
MQIKTFDLLNRPIEKRDEDLSGKLYHQTTYEYDGHNNCKKISTTIDQNPSETCYTYDALNRLIQKTNALNQTTYIYYQNHPQHLKKTTQHPNGTTQEEHYNGQANLLLKRWMDQKSNTLRIEENTYDPNNNLVQILITYAQPDETTKQQTITYNYDPLNRKTAHIESEIKKTTYTYTPTGNQAQIIKPDGVKIKKTYDGKQRLTTLTSSDHTISYRYAYDTRDRLKKVYDHGNLILKRNYDHQDRLIEEQFINHYTIKKTYDLYDRPTTLTYPDHKKATFTYDPYHLKQAHFNNLTQTYDLYDQNGHLLQETLPAGLGTQTHTYNPLGRETARTSPYQTETYTQFDQANNLLARTYNRADTTYTYDPLNQLLTENDTTYTYDTHYNRHTKNETPYTLNTLNQITKTPQTTYTYDPNGNLIQKNTTHYTYDALDRLIAIQTPATKTTYTYDPFHRRLTANNSSYIYDNQKEIGQIQQNTLIQRRLLNPTTPSEIDATILYEIENQTYIPLHSIDGNITALYTPNGDLQHQFTYTAFGEQTLPSTHPWTYQSKREDPTGLIYFGARYYDPTLGRFLTPDPAGYTDSYNTYAYLLNRPFYYQDPTGKWLIAIPLGIEAAAVIKAVICSAAVAIAAWGANEAVDYVNNRIDGAPATPKRQEYLSDGWISVEVPPELYDDYRIHKESSDVYAPDRDLPRDPRTKEPKPESDAPHTQLGTKEGRKGKYPQAREFDINGKPVRDIDFTDHGRSKDHSNPHQHEYKPNPTGGTRSRDPRG